MKSREGGRVFRSAEGSLRGAHAAGAMEDAASAAAAHVERIRASFAGDDIIDETNLAVAGDDDEAPDDLRRRAVRPPNFIDKLIRNADEKSYSNGVDPCMEFLLVPKNITGGDASHTLLVTCNDTGLTEDDVKALCLLRRSEGTGFESVFLYCDQPHIFSNGYSISLSADAEAPGRRSRRRLIPNWIDEPERILSQVSQEYRGAFRHSGGLAPATIMALPLASNKAACVESLLALVPSESLLFSSKLVQLSLCFPNKTSCVSTRRITKKTTDVGHGDGSRATVDLTVAHHLGGGLQSVYKYFVWRESFPVTPPSPRAPGGRHSDRKRPGAGGAEVTLAFPLGNSRPMESFQPSIFSSFPTPAASARHLLPFLVHCNFAGDGVDLMNDWNAWLLSRCIPLTFVNAFRFYLDNAGNPLEAFKSSLDFLPVPSTLRRSSGSPGASASDQTTSHGANVVSWRDTAGGGVGSRGAPSIEALLSDAIKEKVRALRFIPCTSFSRSNQNLIFRERPTEVRRLLPAFRGFLNRVAMDRGLLLREMSSMKSALHPHLEKDDDDVVEVFEYLGVEAADSVEWYAECIRRCAMVQRLDHLGYADLLVAVALNWSAFKSSSMADMPLLKYAGEDGGVELCSLGSCREKKKLVGYSIDGEEHDFLMLWMKKLGYPMYLLPPETRRGIFSHRSKYFLLAWLQLEIGVSATSVRDLGRFLAEFLKEKADMITQLPCFLDDSVDRNLICEAVARRMSLEIPVVDGGGEVRTERAVALVPASGSRWANLFGSTDIYAGYVDLSGVYNAIPGSHRIQALDIPELDPPDVPLLVASSPLDADRALLLLDWLRALRSRGAEPPRSFLESIREGRWMKVADSGFCSPNKCSLGICNNSSSSSNSSVQMVEVDGFVVVGEGASAAIDESYYNFQIRSYAEELKMIGVKVHAQ